MIAIEIHQKDASGDGVFHLWYFDRYGNRRCETKTDADINEMLSPRQFERFEAGDYEFRVSPYCLVGCS
jgi:hypothetical protein